jgi:hypothetical protein
MAGRKHTKTHRRWQELVQRQAASGLSIREFCEQEQISQPSFYAWRRRLRQQPGGGKRSPDTRRGGDRVGASGEFIPLHLVDAPSIWEVVHPSGYRVRVSGEVNAMALQCILSVLDGRTQK